MWTKVMGGFLLCLNRGRTERFANNLAQQSLCQVTVMVKKVQSCDDCIESGILYTNSKY